MLKLALPFVLILAVLALSVASDRPLPPADFTFINRGDVTTLDLQRMSWVQDMRAARMVFEGLVRNDVFSHEFAIEPASAERWEISADQRTYTFHLRPDARWSNGQPLRAGDFVYAWRRALLPDTAADYTGQFQLIRGGAEFFRWRTRALGEYARRPSSERTREAAEALWAQTEARFTELVGLWAPDDRTLVVELEHPVPYFLDLCAMPVFFPVYPEVVSRYETPEAATGRINARAGWTKPPQIVSNGPFVLTRWRFKREMRFEANPHYWNRDALNIRSVSIPSVSDANASVLAFNSGSVDWVSDVTVGYRGEMYAQKLAFYAEHAEEVARLRAQGLDPFEIDRRLPADPRKNLHVVPVFGTYWYNFNCQERLADGRVNPFHDARVRRAFAMTLDKRAICEQVQRTGETPARTVVPPDSLGGYESPRGLESISDPDPGRTREDVAASARALLAEAGYADPSAFPSVEILFNKDAGHDLIAQLAAKNWREHLGVSVVLAQKEIKVFRDDLKNGNFMISRAGWYGDYPYPTTFLDVNRTGDENNDRKYSSPRYDDLLARAARTTDRAEAMSLLGEAERILVEEDLPLIPIYRYSTVYLFDAGRVGGLSPHPISNQEVLLVDVLGDGVGRDVARAMPLSGPADGRAGSSPGGVGDGR